MKQCFLVFISMLFISMLSYGQSTDLLPPGSYTAGIEGPATDRKGNLFAVNYLKEGTIGKVDLYGNPSIYATLPEGSIGNGIRFNRKGEMFVADYKGHSILKITEEGARVDVYAHCGGMSQPNDLTISRKGNIYVSDPDWAKQTGRIWLINKKREYILLEDGMSTTNGIELSPDEQTLYVNETNNPTIWAYDVNKDGTVDGKRRLVAFDDFGLDGMRCDPKGNLYVTRYGKGSVVVVSPQGEILYEIFLKGKKVSNITFSPDYKKCYVTMADRGCFEYFDAPTNR